MNPSTASAAEPRRLVPAAAVALVLPDVGMPRVARLGTVRGPLLVAMLCALLAGVASAHRVDARTETLRKLDQSGELKNSSDRQIDEATKSAERAFIVKRVGGAAVQAPVDLLLFTLGLVIVSWFLRGRAEGRSMVPVAAVALLPGAAANLLETAAVWGRSEIAPASTSLLPRTLGALWSGAGWPASGAAMKLLGAFDLFSLWSAILLGFGLAAVAHLPRRRALPATLFGWVLWRLLTTVAPGAS